MMHNIIAPGNIATRKIGSGKRRRDILDDMSLSDVCKHAW